MVCGKKSAPLHVTSAQDSPISIQKLGMLAQIASIEQSMNVILIVHACMLQSQ